MSDESDDRLDVGDRLRGGRGTRPSDQARELEPLISPLGSESLAGFLVLAGVSVKRRVGIFGASGYVGRELLRLLAGHPWAETAFATGAGDLGHEAGLEREADAYFLALPHGVAARFADTLTRRWPEAVVVDLSGDLRLPTPEAYQRWYGIEHTAPSLLGRAVYGLTELNREQLTA